MYSKTFLTSLATATLLPVFAFGQGATGATGAAGTGAAGPTTSGTTTGTSTRTTTTGTVESGTTTGTSIRGTPPGQGSSGVTGTVNTTKPLPPGTAPSGSGATGTTTTGVVPIPPAGKDVGISARDGIVISGTDVLVTRNGVTEKLTKELGFTNGVRIRPDGTVVKADGSKVTMRPGQLLTFDGELREVLVDRSGNAGTPSSKAGVTTGAAGAGAATGGSQPASGAAPAGTAK